MTAAELFLGKSTAARAAEPERYDILRVDDEPKVRDSLRRMFKEESYRVLTTGNATEAPDLLSREEMQRVPRPRAGSHRLCLNCSAALDERKCCPTCGRPRESELEP